MLLPILDAPHLIDLPALGRIRVEQTLQPPPQLLVTELPQPELNLIVVDLPLLQVDPVRELQPLQLQSDGRHAEQIGEEFLVVLTLGAVGGPQLFRGGVVEEEGGDRIALAGRFPC